MSTQLALVENALSIEQVLGQRNLVMVAMREAMTEGMHYGKIPGCGEKPTLLQPGAQLLCSVFCLDDKLRIAQVELTGGHREYQITCTLRAQNGREWEGVGLCSSMESKYRYRNSAAQVEDTGEPLPKAYWDWKESEGAQFAAKKLGEAFDGAKVGPKKIEGEWRVVRYIGGGDAKVENPNPADTFNTVLKIAKKRAFVDATITATSCNDLFTQDLEDIRENLESIDAKPVAAQVVELEPKAETPREKPATKPAQQPPPVAAPVDGDGWTNVSVQNAEVVTGETNKKPWTFYKITFDSGNIANTFDKAVYDLALSAGQNASDKVNAKVKPGKRQNSWELIGLDLLDELPM